MVEQGDGMGKDRQADLVGEWVSACSGRGQGARLGEEGMFWAERS